MQPLPFVSLLQYSVFRTHRYITLENVLFVSKSINRQVLPIFYDWLTFLMDLHRYETSCSVTDHLNAPTCRTQKYGRFSIRASTIYLWNSTQNLLIKNLSLKNSTSKNIKYFFTKHFITSTNFNILGHSLQGKLQTYMHIYH